MAFSSDVLTLERSGSVATLWLDRPEKRNAMSQPMWTGIGEAMRELSEDSDVRAVVIAGRGKSFCVGIDVSALSGGLGARGEGERVSVYGKAPSGVGSSKGRSSSPPASGWLGFAPGHPCPCL